MLLTRSTLIIKHCKVTPDSVEQCVQSPRILISEVMCIIGRERERVVVQDLLASNVNDNDAC